MVRRASWLLLCGTLWLVLPTAAQAATAKPTVTTGAAASVTQSTVTLTGTVTPHGAATTYFFQYGPTTLYGAQTAPTAAGAGTKAVHVAVAVAALAPFTRYHYRLVAQNAKGLVKGKDRSFKTHRQPLGLTLGTSANPVRFGAPLTVAGMLTGTGNANREVVLQANPFPYTQGFLNVANPQLTSTTGTFSFTLASVALNTQYRVLMPNVPSVVSPIIAEGVAPLLTTHARVRHRVIRFSGSVRPLITPAPVLIQKRRHHRWVTIARAITHRASATRAVYSRRVHHRTSGRYRVVVGSTGPYATVIGHTKHVRVR